MSGAGRGAAPSPEPVAAKSVWRSWARTVRAAQPLAPAGRAVCDALRAWEPYRAATTVLAYLAFGSEVDLGPLLEDEDKRVLVPRTRSLPRGEGGGASLSVHALREAELERSRFGMLEPAADAPATDPATIDLVLVPGLCFDVHGTRLGYGRGYFDRFLASLDAVARSVPLVGVTFEELVVPRLPREPHDVPMSHLATETGVRPVPADR